MAAIWVLIMKKEISKREEILDAAEKLMRKAGFNGFSFREVAKMVEIKSASVHYHFPTKTDIGVAVTQRYTERFLEKLGDPKVNQQDPINHFINIFRKGIKKDQNLCLCGLLGAEAKSLPPELTIQIEAFFEESLKWLEAAIQKNKGKSSSDSKKQSLLILSALEGAAIIGQTLNNFDIFERVAKSFKS